MKPDAGNQTKDTNQRPKTYIISIFLVYYDFKYVYISGTMADNIVIQNFDCSGKLSSVLTCKFLSIKLLKRSHHMTYFSHTNLLGV